MSQADSTGGATPIPHDLFKAELFPERDRFDVWRQSVLPLFDSTPDRYRADDFTARVESFDLQNLFFARSEFTPLRFSRDRHHRAPDGGDHLVVQLYTKGGYVGENGGRPVCVDTGDISLLDLGRSLRTEAPAAANLTLVIPRDSLLAVAGPRGLQHGTVLRAGTPVGRILANHLLTVWNTLPDATVDQLDGINATLVGAVAGAFSRGPIVDESVRHAAERATLDAVRLYIQSHLDSDRLTPASLCRQFGCSRSRLYRLFEPLGGIATYIRRQRLDRCYQDLVNSAGRHRIVDIALRWGFDSQSHFSRLFRRAYGISPSDAVALGRERRRHAGAGRDPGAVRTPAFHDWLRRL